jgi:hypothetical protein
MIVGVDEYQVELNSLSNSSGDEDLQGLTTYNLQGEIKKSNQLQNDFNGEISIRIFNTPISKTTRGDENPIFQFKEFEGLIFQGKAVINNGIFNLDFIVPKLDNEIQADGKILMYAISNDDIQKEASGYSNVSISPVNNSLADNIIPTARLFINDTTFINGGISNENPVLIAQFEDDSGFDVTGNEGTKIEAMLDGDSTFNVTSYFISNVGQFNKGTISFQLFDLRQGNHQIQLTFYDLSGNKGMATVDFVVGELNQLEISEVVGWPNPFSDKVRIGFFHNRSGEDLQGQLVITSVYGKPIRVIDFEAINSPFSTEFMEWDATDFNGSKVTPGVYILHLSLRSLMDGSKNEAFTKLILSN